jgi:hypothetical protein
LGQALVNDNVYSFLNNRPQNDVDILGLYGIDGHFYTTFLVGMAAGLGKQTAFTLAYYSQLPDQVGDFSAFDDTKGRPNGIKKTVSEVMHGQWLKDIQELLHSLHGDLAAPRQECLSKLLQDPSLQAWERGLIIHALGDSYAHTYKTLDADEMHLLRVAYAYPIGHAFTPDGGHNPDIIRRHPDLYDSYLSNLYTALSPSGQGANPTLLQNLQAFSRTLSADPATAIQQMSQYARQNGYDFPYEPSGVGNTDQSMDNLDRDMVTQVLEKIRKACCPSKR